MTAPNAGKITRLCSLIDQATNVCIVSHLHPDGDAIGSSTALWHYLQKQGINSTVIFSGEIPGSLSFLGVPGSVDSESDLPEASRAIAMADLIVALDINDFHRAGQSEDVLKGSRAPKVLIDHHLNPSEQLFDLVFSETAISSASELLYWILMEMPDIAGDAGKLPPEAATALMTGMTTDTNNFANSIYPTTFRMASSLLAAGVDRDAVLDHVFCSYRENRLRLMGLMLHDLMKISEYGVAYMIIDRRTILEYDISEGDTEGFVNMPLAIKGVRMSLLLKEDYGYFRVSIRSKKGVSASSLAAGHFHGGGHEQASGGRLYWPDDIAGPEGAAKYVEEVTARFMQNNLSPIK